jgi:hypothetical protein
MSVLIAGVLIHQLRHWFGGPSFLFNLLMLTLLLVLALLAAKPTTILPAKFEWAFLSTCAAVIFLGRFPTFFWNKGLNADEGLWAAGAIKATVDLVPWRGFDPTTSGPLNSYVLALPALLHLPISFISTRIIGAALMIGTISALYHAVKCTYNPRIARLTVIPAVVFLSLETDGNFVHYSSEYLSVFLTTIALAAAAHIAWGSASFKALLGASAVAGLCLGATCFAKLQALPIMFAVSLLTFLAIFVPGRLSRREVTIVAAVFVASFCLIPGTILVVVWLTDQFEYAFTSYIKLSLRYIDFHPKGEPIEARRGIDFQFLLGSTPNYTILLCSVIFLVSVGVFVVFVRRNRLTRRSISTATAAALLLLASLYSISKPHRPFAHYLLFSLVPLSCCLAIVLGLTDEVGIWKDRRVILSGGYLAFAIIPTLSVALSTENQYLSSIRTNLKTRQGPEAAAIAHYARPGDRVAIWGWAADYWVETGTVMATREPTTCYNIYQTSFRDYFRAHYMADLRRAKPPVFVDAVAPSAFEFTKRGTCGYETFPELAQYISEHYELKEEVNGARIFVRKGAPD